MTRLRLYQTTYQKNWCGLKERHILLPSGMERYAVYLWQQWNGTIPKGSVVDFNDCDHENFDIENLILTPRAELSDRYQKFAYKELTLKARKLYKSRIETAYSTNLMDMVAIRSEERKMIRLLLLADKHRGRNANLFLDEEVELIEQTDQQESTPIEVKVFDYSGVKIPRPGIDSKKQKGAWSYTELKFLVDNFQLNGNTDLAKMVADKFGRQISGDAVKYQLTRLGLKRTAEQTAALMKKENAGHFKKGNEPVQTLQDGVISIRTDSKGRKYKFIRLSKGEWIHLHVKVWEECHGREVPEGYAIIFKDGDTMNCVPDNLRCVSRAELLRINQGQDIQTRLEELQARVRYKNARIIKDYKFKGSIPEPNNPSDYLQNQFH